MKVAIYSGTIPSTVFIENLIKAIASEDLEIYLFGTGSKKHEYDNPNIRQFITPTGGLKRVVFTIAQILYSLLFFPKRLFKLIRIKRVGLEWRETIQWLSKTLPVIIHLPDVFHVQWAKSVSDWIFLKDLFDIKIVLSLRGAHINYSPICDPELALLYKDAFPRCDAFHAVSKAIGTEAEKYGAEPSKISVIYSGVDLEKINTIKMQQQSTPLLMDYGQINDSTSQPSWPAGKQINIISVGRMHWIKGYTYSIDACKILLDTGVNFSYKIIAEGDCQEFMYQIEDLGLKDFVSIIPGLPHSETLEYIANSDILILPSIKEGLANVLMEAISLGTFVISTDSGGLNEIVDDQNVAQVVPRFNSQAIAKAIREFQTKPMVYSQSKDSYSIRSLKKVGEEMEHLYESIYEGIET